MKTLSGKPIFVAARNDDRSRVPLGPHYRSRPNCDLIGGGWRRRERRLGGGVADFAQLRFFVFVDVASAEAADGEKLRSDFLPPTLCIEGLLQLRSIGLRVIETFKDVRDNVRTSVNGTSCARPRDSSRLFKFIIRWVGSLEGFPSVGPFCFLGLKQLTWIQTSSYCPKCKNLA